MKTKITIERLKEVITYNAETGEFTWLVSLNGRAKPGDSAGNISVLGYRRIGIDRRCYKASRLAIFYMTGKWPEFDVDHINGDSTDDRYCNLRDVPTVVNLQNQRRAKSNNKSTGALGVVRDGSRFRAQIKAGGKRHELGAFPTIAEASQAYIEAKRKLHPGNTL